MRLQYALILLVPLNAIVSPDSLVMAPVVLTPTNAFKTVSVEIIQSVSTSLVVLTVFVKTVIPTPMVDVLTSMSVRTANRPAATCILALILLVLSNVAALTDGSPLLELTMGSALTSMNVSMKTSMTAMSMLPVPIPKALMNVNVSMDSLVMVEKVTALSIPSRLSMNAPMVHMIAT